MVLCSPIDFLNKRVFFIAPHPDDDVIGCGALLLFLSKYFMGADSSNIDVAYATSGFRGVTDRFLQENVGEVSEANSRELKTELRKNEALACCNYLGVTEHFWNLTFYESGKKEFSDEDVSAVVKSIKEIAPDVIILIDESGDPHGTHGLVRDGCLQAIRVSDYSGTLLGYRVWDTLYEKNESDVVLSFGHELTAEKQRLIKNHKSQISDPAFPHEHHSFFELAEKRDREAALRMGSSFPYAECYKNLKF